MTLTSTLPEQSEFHHAVLRHLAQLSAGDRQGNIYEAVADLLNLNPAQRCERLENMPHLRYRHRAGWSLGVLKKAGFVECPQNHVWRITDLGHKALSTYPDGFDGMSARELLARITGQTPQTGNGIEAEVVGIVGTPQERIDAAITDIYSSVADQLRDRLANTSPEFFETLVLQLLHRMGYGSTEDDIEHVGGPGDAGIDGVISLDKLGFERVCVQAKRQKDTVRRPDVQAFFGALAGRRARKGVFITTSNFSDGAKAFAEGVAEGIILIDGERLASLMIEFQVGVTHSNVRPLPKVDADFFDGE